MTTGAVGVPMNITRLVAATNYLVRACCVLIQKGYRIYFMIDGGQARTCHLCIIVATAPAWTCLHSVNVRRGILLRLLDIGGPNDQPAISETCNQSLQPVKALQTRPLQFAGQALRPATLVACLTGRGRPSCCQNATRIVCRCSC